MVKKIKLTERKFSKLEIGASQQFSKQEKDQLIGILKEDHCYTIEETTSLLKKEQRRVVE